MYVIIDQDCSKSVKKKYTDNVNKYCHPICLRNYVNWNVDSDAR